MSKYDHGKHYKTDDGKNLPNTKRIDAQKPSKVLSARIAGHEEAVRSSDAKVRSHFNKPGSQNRNK